MNDIYRRTVRSFLHKESPETKAAAKSLLDDWFSRYGLDAEMLSEEVDRHFTDRAAL